MAKKFGLETNNLLLGHEDNVQNLGPYQGCTLVRNAKLEIHLICLASELTTGELEVDWHGGK
ncbi:hypothetical protein C1H46_012842 [Malus baccata]|uniref:Uncharacterized protein n=1 Tax=Malus baccata TaxID=106549 RepID=A0A540MS55_MALBA|nr:hypothetical protein C1H46_012842 [Malus baccata]